MLRLGARFRGRAVGVRHEPRSKQNGALSWVAGPRVVRLVGRTLQGGCRLSSDHPRHVTSLRLPCPLTSKLAMAPQQSRRAISKRTDTQAGGSRAEARTQAPMQVRTCAGPHTETHTHTHAQTRTQRPTHTHTRRRAHAQTCTRADPHADPHRRGPLPCDKEQVQFIGGRRVF